MIKVLVVDDSAFMRNAISSMLNSDPKIKVIGMARDGVEAVEKVKSLKPDIVTLDVEMPRMDGIEALKRIMAENPVPVVMVSSLTTDGAKETLEALEIGALDLTFFGRGNLRPHDRACEDCCQGNDTFRD